MKIPFACPSCAAQGTTDASFVGRQCRCKHCGHRFAIPDPGEGGPDEYALEEPTATATGFEAPNPVPDSVFVPNRGDESSFTPAPRRPRREAPKSAGTGKSSRRDAPGFAWRVWLVRAGAAAVLALVGTALLAPRGTLIAGCVLLAFGSFLVVLAYGAGAYGAFREDFVYGVLYLAVPLYTGYYLLTRWEDLWPWFAASTVGVALVMLGGALVQWAGGAG